MATTASPLYVFPVPVFSEHDIIQLTGLSSVRTVIPYSTAFAGNDVKVDGAKLTTAYGVEAAREAGEARFILFGLCGHGNFDLSAYDAYLAGELEDPEFSEHDMNEALAHLPQGAGDRLRLRAPPSVAAPRARLPTRLRARLPTRLRARLPTRLRARRRASDWWLR